jgi:hypothetical protein
MKKKNDQLLMRKECTAKSKNVHGFSKLTDLAYFDIIEDTLLDMMHITGNVIGKNLHGMMTSRFEKGKDAQGEFDDVEEKVKGGKTENEIRQIAAKERHALLQELHVRYQMFHVDDAGLERLDEYYKKVMAPIGVAPKSIKPFKGATCMNTHHWVQFTKSWGKYLLQIAYWDKNGLTMNEVLVENRALMSLCALVDLVTACLASDATSENKRITDVYVKDLARKFSTVFGDTVMSLQMHLLFHHIPTQTRLWGPARSYWCFPFERSVRVDEGAMRR